jgi:hypothetical protein
VEEAKLTVDFFELTVEARVERGIMFPTKLVSFCQDCSKDLFELRGGDRVRGSESLEKWDLGRLRSGYP